MPYFCEKSGVRTCVPGIAVSAGGRAPEHTNTDRHQAAEDAAACVIGGHVGLPTPQTVARAVDLVVDILSGRPREPGRSAEQQLEHDDHRSRRAPERDRDRAGERVERPRKADPKAPPAAAPEEAPAPKADASDAPATELPTTPAAG
jgi:hypothetical protein